MDRCERGSAWKEGRRTRDKRRRRTTGHLLTYIGKGLGETLTLTPMERLPWICVCVCVRERDGKGFAITQWRRRDISPLAIHCFNSSLSFVMLSDAVFKYFKVVDSARLPPHTHTHTQAGV